MYKSFQNDPSGETVDADRRRMYRRISDMARDGQLQGKDAMEVVTSQWVSDVNAFSSQYDEKGWSAFQVIGPPKVYPKYGDITGAWAPKTIDRNQFLELEFEHPVFVTSIDIYETYHAGGVTAVKGRDSDGQWKTLWSRIAPNNLTVARIFSPPLQELGCRTRHMRLDVDCTAANIWVEIDAVQLHGKTVATVSPPPVNGLLEALGSIVNEKAFSDVTFTFGDDKSLYAHKAILCARSAYFSAMFDSAETKESTLVTGLYPVPIVDVDYDSFLAMLHYIYTNDVPGHYDSLKLTDVWRTADKYQIDGLQKLCNSLIISRLNENNVVDTYVSANNSFPVNDVVRDNCVMYIAANMKKVVDTSSFERLPQDIMVEIIQKSTANMTFS